MTAAPSAARLREAVRVATTGLVEREALVELIVLAAVANEHLLVVGPPGTAKSEAVRRIAKSLGGKTFEYLLGRFTEPSELFGPIDLRRLREGEVVTETTGMLPEAEIAFLDEVFLGSTAILNTLLGLLAERRFRRGHTDLAVPLRVCVGASNSLPDDPGLAAFADRFLLRVFVEPLADPRLEELLEGGAGLVDLSENGKKKEPAKVSDIDAVSAVARKMDLSKVRPRLAQAIRTLRRAGIALSDRRAVKTQRLVAAAAALAGRTEPTEADLWPIVIAVPTAQGQAMARESLHDLLAKSENPSLVAATIDASAGPLARAHGLVDAGERLLSAARDDGWLLKIEGVLREIDAGYARGTLPDALEHTRSALVSAVAAGMNPEASA